MCWIALQHGTRLNGPVCKIMKGKMSVEINPPLLGRNRRFGACILISRTLHHGHPPVKIGGGRLFTIGLFNNTRH